MPARPSLMTPEALEIGQGLHFQGQLDEGISQITMPALLDHAVSTITQMGAQASQPTPSQYQPGGALSIVRPEAPATPLADLTQTIEGYGVEPEEMARRRAGGPSGGTPMAGSSVTAPRPMAGSSGAQAAPSDPSSWEGKAWAAAVQAGHPNPREFVEQMRWESGNFAPDVVSGQRNSSAGARGIAQIMPQYHPGVDPLDPDAALAYAANLMTQHYQTYGNSDEALTAYNGGGGAVGRLRAGRPFEESRRYLDEIHARTADGATGGDTNTTGGDTDTTGAASQGVTRPGGGPAWGTYTPETLTPNQINEGEAQGLSHQQALAICGPAAAVAFARVNGRNPTIREATELAQSLGLWDQGTGMHGPESQVQLLAKLGVPATLHAGVDWGFVRSEVDAGRPVILDSPLHYWTVTGYDAQSGQFEFGQSAGVLTAAGGRTRWRPEEIAGLGMGAPRATIVLGGPAGRQN